MSTAPQYARTTTVAGYHLHLIDDTRAVGGHVLDVALRAGRVSIDQDADLHVELPASPRGAHATMTDEAIADAIARADNAPVRSRCTAFRSLTVIAPILES